MKLIQNNCAVNEFFNNSDEYNNDKDLGITINSVVLESVKFSSA